MTFRPTGEGQTDPLGSRQQSLRGTGWSSSHQSFPVGVSCSHRLCASLPIAAGELPGIAKNLCMFPQNDTRKDRENKKQRESLGGESILPLF